MKTMNWKPIIKRAAWLMATVAFMLGLAGCPGGTAAQAASYAVVDTGQGQCYSDAGAIPCPGAGEEYYGQDAQQQGNQPSYTKSDDGLTVHDNVTGLTWTQSPDLNDDGVINIDDKLTFSQARDYVSVLNEQGLGGYSDWRLPSMKELYSLMSFAGTDISGHDDTGAKPFIDTNYFAFAYGDTAAGERPIDSQFWSSNVYTAYVFGGQTATFGLNLADGRIKGYPVDKLNYVYFVRGGSGYGVNAFTDNGDGTVTDQATGLMWTQSDSGQGMDWPSALAWVQTMNQANHLGHGDWRLPDAKELHTLVDYFRSPDATGSAAIDPVFNTTYFTNEAGQTDFPWYWTSTTHVKSTGDGSSGVYICFGRAMGFMHDQWMDVHGAGAQRCDAKTENLDDYAYQPDGYYMDWAPQGDAVRINNYVRLVRDAN